MPVNRHRPNHQHELVGVVPAAGTASRLGPLPCSKELLPVWFHKERRGSQLNPKAVGHYLLERMQSVNVSKVFIILRKGKWDIPTYFGDGRILDMHIAYLLMDLPFGVPFTIDQAYPFIKNATVVFGFPDILFKPKDAYEQLLDKQQYSRADLVLGLFPAKNSEKVDMVELDDEGFVHGIQIKPSQTSLKYTWILAVWTSVFTHFMHEFVINHLKKANSEKDMANRIDRQEIFVGDVIQAAIDNNLNLNSLVFTKGSFIDIGTPDDLARAIQIHFN
jgi:glucose-1-phosphate thymidylyltransferase